MVTARTSTAAAAAELSQMTQELQMQQMVVQAMAMAQAGNLFAGKPIVAGDEVEFHDGTKIILPTTMTYQRARAILDRLEKEAETITNFSQTFRYRPWDGAYAAAKVLRDRYGVIFGEKIDMGIFGEIKPEARTIFIDVDTTVQVPWGQLSIPSLDRTTINLHGAKDKDYGLIFGIMVEAPRKYKDEINALFEAVATYLKSSSIYRGKSVIGSNELEFLDLRGFDRTKIVFSDEVDTTLEGTLFAPLKYTDTMRKEKLSLKRALLAHGDYGTGKSSLGMITAQIANENGWTFISAKPGEDNVQDVLRTARMYQPAVVFIEDIDTQTNSGGDQDEVTKFLDAFDGITAKGGEIVAVMTSNHLDKVHKGMLRPGRLDAVVKIGALDRNGTERLTKLLCGDKLEDDIDFDAVYASMHGFTPAFVKEALERAKTFAIARLSGGRNFKLATSDLVGAAVSLHSQLEAINSASEGIKVPSLDAALRNTVTTALDGMRQVDSDGDESGWYFRGTQVDPNTVDLDLVAGNHQRALT